MHHACDAPTKRTGSDRLRVGAFLLVVVSASLFGPPAGAGGLTKQRILAIFASVDRLIDCASYQNASGRRGCESARNRYAACAVESELFARATDCAGDRVFLSRIGAARAAELQHRAGRSEVKPGMTAKQVLEVSAWGPPLWRDKTIRRGRAYERWDYGDGRQLDITKGRVTGIRTGP